MPKISEHSALRYQERVDPAEPFPKERLREIVDGGETSHREDIEGAVIEAKDALVVLKDDVVTTVLRRSPA
jgi:hypothetical protein